MRRNRFLQAGLLAPVLLGAGVLRAVAAQDDAPHRAPGEPVRVSAPVSDAPQTQASSRAPSQAFSHGDPSGDEQAILEMINRARANPTAEGVRLATTTDPDVLSAYKYFNVDTAALQSDFASYPAEPPLAFNSSLIDSARAHSQDMAANNFQSHTGSDNSTFTDRMTKAGYPSNVSAGENIYAYAKSLWYGHAGLNADWGVSPPGHRQNIMNYTGAVYNEAGIGIVTKSSVASGQTGPIVITQDFGQRSASVCLVGVVYTDANGNGFYDSGEGIGGVTVMPDAGTYYAVTSSSGGYAIPVAGLSGTLNVTFSGGSLASSVTQSASLTGKNVKLDYALGGSGNGGGSGSTSVVRTLCVATPQETALALSLANSTAAGLTYAVTASPASGTLSGLDAATGAVTYTPATSFTGTDLFKFTVTDAAGAVTQGQVIITVQASGATGTVSAADTDKDGYPDELELFTGTQPAAADAAPAAAAFDAKAKFALKLNFSKPGKDTLSLSWTQTVASGFQLSGRVISIDAGGVMASFTLDSKGKAKNDSGTCQIRGKFKNGAAAADQTAKFTIKLSKGTYAASVADEGLRDDRTYQRESFTVPVFVLIAGTANTLTSGTASVTYSAKTDKTGNAKGGF